MNFATSVVSVLAAAAAAVLVASAGSAAGDVGKPIGGPGYCAPLGRIADAVAADAKLKPLTRKALKPKDASGPLQFKGRDGLTKRILEAYLARAVSHMSIMDDRSREFLHYTGAKFVHWSDLGWVRLYKDEDWQRITSAVDAIHLADWGQDVIVECGVMEAIGRSAIDSTPIPPWLLKVLTDLGIQDKRVPGPNGSGYFSYEAMFDRSDEVWAKRMVGRWVADLEMEQSVPDLTMLETQLYYAYVIAEYIDAGFEAIMFGQTMLTGARDIGNEALHNICEFAKRWAGLRGYRGAVALSSHVIYPTDYPKTPEDKARPLFTHLTWPTRLSYTQKNAMGMHFGPDAKEEGRRQGGGEIVRLLQLPHDLPILLEIDNYGPSKGPNAVCDQGYDEITAYAAKNPEQRAAFLRYYYAECRKWKNRDNMCRTYLALPGYRCLTMQLSQCTLEDGTPSKPTSWYLPYREDGGEEETMRELFVGAPLP